MTKELFGQKVSAFPLTFSTRRKNMTRSLRVEMPDEEKCFFIADDIEAKRAEVKAKYPKP